MAQNKDEIKVLNIKLVFTERVKIILEIIFSDNCSKSIIDQSDHFIPKNQIIRTIFENNGSLIRKQYP